MAIFITNCPHCNAELDAQEDWVGMEVECPACNKEFKIPKNSAQSASAAFTASAQTGNAGTFTLICPSCNSMAELPMSMAGQKYECKACCDEFIAEPVTEKKCPHCQQMIKINAKRCKFCKKEVTADSLNDKIRQKSKDVLATSLQVSQKIKARLNLKRTIFIVSCLFFLTSSIVFICAVFSKKPHFENRYVGGSGGTDVSTSSYGSISVGESSYGTYKNAIRIASNTNEMITLSERGQDSLSKYYAADQRRKMLFNSSYSLLGIAFFLLFVSFFIDQIFDKKEIIAANQDPELKNAEI